MWMRALPSDHRSITTPRNIAKHHNSLQILGGYAVHPADSHLDPPTLHSSRNSRIAR